MTCFVWPLRDQSTVVPAAIIELYDFVIASGHELGRVCVRNATELIPLAIGRLSGGRKWFISPQRF